MNECQKAVESITLENTISSNNKENSTSADELAEAQANADLTSETASFEEYKSRKLADLDSEIKEVQYQIDDLKLLISNAQAAAGSGSSGADPNPSSSPSTAPAAPSGSETLFEQQRNLVVEKISVINGLGGAIANDKTQPGWPWEDAVKNWYNSLPWTTSDEEIQKK